MTEPTRRFDADAMCDTEEAVYRGISNISNDSIRHLIKIASIGIEEQLSLDNIDLTDICESWDVPLGPDFEERDTMPMDLQMEVDAMRQQLHQGDFRGAEAPMMDYEGAGMMSQVPNPMPYNPVDEGRYDYHSQATQQDGSHTFSDSAMTHSVEYRMAPEMDVQRPRINLPAVTVLPSQVIHAPEPHPAGNVSPQQYNGLGGTNADMNWQYSQQQDLYPDPAMYNMQQGAPDYQCNLPNSVMSTVNGEFSRMVMNPEDDPFNAARRAQMEQGYTHGPGDVLFRGDPMDARLDQPSGKVVRKNTKGEKLPVDSDEFKPEDFMKTPKDEPLELPSSLELPQIESQSAEIRKIESMTEAEICNYVKSMAPQLQNHAWEEVVRETKFEERLGKAEQKMQEHNKEMERIKKEMAAGRLDHKTGSDMLRKVYNRREAAASRTKREQGLVKAAIKKRTLEKICSWMREHLIGNSDLFRTTSTDDAVRRSRSLGTQYQYLQEAADE